MNLSREATKTLIGWAATTRGDRANADCRLRPGDHTCTSGVGSRRGNPREPIAEKIATGQTLVERGVLTRGGGPSISPTGPRSWSCLVCVFTVRLTSTGSSSFLPFSSPSSRALSFLDATLLLCLTSPHSCHSALSHRTRFFSHAILPMSPFFR